MDFNFIPSLPEFKLLVNSFNFNEVDIDLQSKTAREVGYDSLEHYLEFQYYFLTKAFNLDGITEEIGKEFKETQLLKFKSSLLAEHYDESFEEELKPILERVQKLPADVINRISRFETKLRNLFLVALIEKNRDNKPAVKFLKSFLIDFAKQIYLTDPEQGKECQILIDAIDGIMMSESNQEIQNQISPHYYFPNKTHLLDSLQVELVKLNYLKPHVDFESMFAQKRKPPSAGRIEWLADMPKLFYLLYRLNDRKAFVHEVPLHVIAGDLFQFRTEKSADNIRTNYNKVIGKFEDEEYLAKKMNDLKNSLDFLLK